MKNKILNFLATLYCDSWLFMKITWPVMNFKDNVAKLYKEYYNKNSIVNDEFDAHVYRLINMKRYSIIPYSYKYKIIQKIINENTD